MPKKIRVYELGRELGLTNKEALDLCIQLGIGVKSHSSSIEEQQADRVRRKADQEGLRRPVQPEEPAKSDAPAKSEAPAAEAPRTEAPKADERPAAPSSAPSRPAAASNAPRPDEHRAPAAASSAPAESRPPADSRPRPGVVSSAPHSPAAPARPATPAPRPAATNVPSRPAASSAPPEAPSAPRPPASAPAAQAPAASPAAPSAPSAPPAHRPAAAPAAAAHASAAAAPASAAHAPAAAPGAPTTPAAPAVQSAPAAPQPAHTAPQSAPAAPAAAPAAPSAPSAGAPAAPRAPGAPAAPLAPAASAAAPSAPRSAGPPPGGPRAAAPPPGNGQQVLSPSGKPIPPPPGVRRPPMSPSGKPIPPPPGRGPGARTGGPAGTGGPRTGGGPGGPRTGGGPGGPRTGGGPGGPRTGVGAGGGWRPGGPGGARTGGAPGAGGGAPGGGPGGRPGGGFNRGGPPRRRRSGRRRRNIEELEAQEITHYTPSNAPVPDGEVIIERGSTAQELGPKLNRSGADVVRFLFGQGEMVTTTQSLSDDMIELFAAELGAAIRLVDPGEEKEAELQAKYFDDEEEDEENLRPRPPVVTVMGHVDHGKTLLLDRIRETNVVAGEAGGITQHIGAYQVEYGGQLVTFIDTPGHAAFTAMRARGAEVTDIVILVVAADDGVMPQTIEAIAHARAADVPLIVAINKVDRDNADPNRVMQELSQHELVPESWGGDTIMVEISALQNLGIEDLLEQVLLVAELEELVANPEGRGRGIVLEANLDPGKGPVATVIVQSGTLRTGDPIVAGAAWGRVKALLDENGDQVKEAAPSTPVQVLGFGAVPAAGDEFRVTDKPKTARDIGEQREQRFRAADLRRTSSATGTGAKLEDIFEQIQRGETASLNLVLKADTQGSLEAVTESLRKLERDEVKVSFILRGVGGITENDVTLAEASNATILGFNVRPDRGARDLADQHDVEVRTYEIIYKLIEDIEAAMVGMLAPEYEEVITGEAEVREIFRVPRIGAIAGCYVRDGVISRGSKVRFLRDGVIIWKGQITSLRRFKDDVREVHENFECGIGLSNNQDLQPGDIIETFDEREIPRT